MRARHAQQGGRVHTQTMHSAVRAVRKERDSRTAAARVGGDDVSGALYDGAMLGSLAQLRARAVARKVRKTASANNAPRISSIL